jgi:hypothetical protein
LPTLLPLPFLGAAFALKAKGFFLFTISFRFCGKVSGFLDLFLYLDSQKILRI